MSRTPFTATNLELKLLVAKAEHELKRRQAVESTRGTSRILNSLELRESLKSSHHKLTYKKLATIAPLEKTAPNKPLAGIYKIETTGLVPKLRRIVGKQ